MAQCSLDVLENRSASLILGSHRRHGDLGG